MQNVNIPILGTVPLGSRGTQQVARYRIVLVLWHARLKMATALPRKISCTISQQNLVRHVFLEVWLDYALQMADVSTLLPQTEVWQDW